jgi:Domain of unknown function (DUF4383)
MARAAGDTGADNTGNRIGRRDETTYGGNDRAVGKTPAQTFALIFGVVYLLVGIIGFFVSGFDHIVGKDPDKILYFSVNVLHNVVHVLIGILWIVASRAHAAAKSANVAIGAVYLILGIIGLVNLDILGFLAANTADNWLHVVTGALALLFGTAAAGDPARGTVRSRTA